MSSVKAQPKVAMMSRESFDPDEPWTVKQAIIETVKIIMKALKYSTEDYSYIMRNIDFIANYLSFGDAIYTASKKEFVVNYLGNDIPPKKRFERINNGLQMIHDLWSYKDNPLSSMPFTEKELEGEMLVIIQVAEQNRANLEKNTAKFPALLNFINRCDGAIVDIKRRLLISLHVPIFEDIQDFPKTEGGNLVVETSEKQSAFKKDAVTFTKFSQGAVLRIWLWKGRVFVSSRRKLIAMSMWENSDPFLKILYYSGCPQPREFFSSEAKFSPYVHYIIVNSPDLDIIGYTPDFRARGVYLNNQICWGASFDLLRNKSKWESLVKIPIDDVEMKITVPAFDEETFTMQKTFTINEALTEYMKEKAEPLVVIVNNDELSKMKVFRLLNPRMRKNLELITVYPESYNDSLSKRFTNLLEVVLGKNSKERSLFLPFFSSDPGIKEKIMEAIEKWKEAILNNLVDNQKRWLPGFNEVKPEAKFYYLMKFLDLEKIGTPDFSFVAKKKGEIKNENILDIVNLNFILSLNPGRLLNSYAFEFQNEGEQKIIETISDFVGKRKHSYTYQDIFIGKLITINGVFLEYRNNVEKILANIHPEDYRRKKKTSIYNELINRVFQTYEKKSIHDVRSLFDLVYIGTIKPGDIYIVNRELKTKLKLISKTEKEGK